MVADYGILLAHSLEPSDCGWPYKIWTIIGCLLYFDLCARRVRVVVIFLECYCVNEPRGRAQLFEDLEWGWQNPVWPPLVIRVFRVAVL